LFAIPMILNNKAQPHPVGLSLVGQVFIPPHGAKGEDTAINPQG